MESLGVFDGEMQRTITILASAGAPTDLEGDSGNLGSIGEPNDNLDQTGDGLGLVLVNGDLSLLPKPGSGGTRGGQLQSGILVSGDISDRDMTRTVSQNGDVTLMIIDRVPPDIGAPADARLASA